MVTVYILNDSVVEDTEFFNLALISEDSAVMLNPATARINIEDMDSKLTDGSAYTFVLFTIIQSKFIMLKLMGFVYTVLIAWVATNL